MAATKEWFGVPEIAELLNVTPRAVQIRANNEDWQRRPRAGRGGGFEYHVSSLPEHARARIAAHTVSQKPVSIENSIRAAGLASYGGLAGRDKRRADARLALIAQLDDFIRISNLSKSKAVQSFCALYNLGDVEVDDDVRAEIPDVHHSTILRWRKELKAQGVARLAGNYGNRKGSSKIDTQPELREFALGFINDFPHTSAANMVRGAKAHFADRDDIQLPSERSVERWLATWKQENKQLYQAIKSPDAWKNKFMAAFGDMSESVLRPNHLWELDSTPADVMLLDGRHSLIGLIDVYPRRVKLHVSKTSKAAAVVSVMRRGLLDFGVPEAVKTDNGADYKSKHVRGVIAALEIASIYCPPFQGDRKPHIERFFKTFSHSFVELMPGYIGHNVAERKAIESRRSFADRLMKKGGDPVEIKMTSAELQAWCDQWVDHVYHNKPHANLNKQSPNQVLAAWPGTIMRIEDERALDILLINEGFPTVTKKGIRFDNCRYIHPELSLHIGNKVRVKRDPEDMGRIYVFDEDAQFICIAEDPNVTGISRELIARAARKLQLEQKQEERRQAKAASKKHNTKDIFREILDVAKRDNNVTVFPKPSQPHNTSALQSSGVAAQANEMQPRTADITPDARAELKRELQKAPVRVIDNDNPLHRYRRWARFEQRIEQGEYVDPKDRAGLTRYQQSDEYRSMKALAADFGLTQREDSKA